MTKLLGGTALGLLSAAGFVLVAGTASAPAQAQEYTIPTVVKIDGIQWFNRMREGVDRYAADTGNNSYQVGPAQADAQLQVQIIEDLIAQDVDAITVVPFSPEALEPVLARARENGIVVIAHEASNIENADWDIEAFQNVAYGAHIMDQLAACMGEEGEYAVFVGGLTSRTHNEWIDGAIARQEEAYPNMTLVGDRNETYDDQQRAYARAQELLRNFPNLRGFQGSASTDVAGIGLALEERGMEDDTCVMGTSLPSISGQYLETGAVDGIFFWDPADAGYVMQELATMVLNGDEIAEGMDLGVPGYNSVTIDGHVIYGQAWVDVTAENMADYPF
ncbi:MAG: autoinducer 2 ABC transporter substrate-binding protein [Rhodospirillaceae bacterium]|nr:autoinducer 2 ABC transporter substrate-binding protein [Rhodospirillaceae bacterium]MCA8932927.1 autoinducer 2 ABC transporter substrate-binding protein [Rhodospirillaceae bacterium]